MLNCLVLLRNTAQQVYRYTAQYTYLTFNYTGWTVYYINSDSNTVSYHSTTENMQYYLRNNLFSFCRSVVHLFCSEFTYLLRLV